MSVVENIAGIASDVTLEQQIHSGRPREFPYVQNKFHNYTTSNSTYFYVLTTIGSLLRELNNQWSLLTRWRGEQTVPHMT